MFDQQILAAWKEAALERLLRYVAVDTTANASNPTPSSPGQLELGRQLMDELRRLGLQDVRQDDYGHVTATVPATPGHESAPTIGYLAHFDTSPDAPGGGIKTRVLRNYGGEPVTFPRNPGLSIDPTSLPELAASVGHDLVFTDGTTLLGADDQAGLAEIMTAAQFLMDNPDSRHGTIKLLFTPDE